MDENVIKGGNPSYPNVAIEGNFKIAFSNIPTIDTLQRPNDIKFFEGYIRQTSLHGLMTNVYKSNNMGKSERHTFNNGNIDEEALNITFKLSEEYTNWLYLYLWLHNVNHGIIEADYKTMYESTIKSIDVIILNNNKKEVCQFKYIDCKIAVLDDINLIHGSAEQVEFSATFEYKKVEFKVLNEEDYDD